MADETSLEGAAEYLVLMLDENLYTLILEFADDASTQIDNLLIIIRQSLLYDTVLYVLLGVLIEETEHQLHGLIE